MLEFLSAHQHIQQQLLQTLRMSVILVLLTMFFVPLEHFFAVRKSPFHRAAWQANLGWYYLNGFLVTVLLAFPAFYIAKLIHFAIPSSITGAAAELPLWARMVAAMVVGEVGYYWGHRLSHEVPFLWRFHAVHHSAEAVNFLVNGRGHPVDMIFTRLCGTTLLLATGLESSVGKDPGVVVAGVLLIVSIWSYFIHSNVRIRLGFLEEVISTPAFHHWHHTREDHKDRNYSSMVPVMDRIFGTFYLPKAWPEVYGTDTPMPADLIGQILEPFAPRPKPLPMSIGQPG